MKKLVVTSLMVITLVGVAREVRAQHAPPSVEDCASQIPNLPIDVVANSTGFFTVPGFFDEGCMAFTWVQFPGNVTNINVGAIYGGANISTSDWDCNHSSITYALFKRLSNGTWTLVTHDQRFGFLWPAPNLSCDYNSGRAFPAAVGPGWDIDSSSPGTEYRLAVQSWQHNDPSFGHPGTACATPSCHWNSTVIVQGLTRR